MALSKKFIYPLISFSVVIIIWQLVAMYSGWSESVFPGPLPVLNSFFELVANGSIFNHSVASLYRVTIGFYLGAIVGIPLGILIGRVKAVSYALNPIIQFLRPISPLAWIPLAMLWFGLGDNPAIFLIFLSSFFPIVVATAIAVSSINPIYFQVASNFNLSRVEMITKIVVPAILPEVVTALRLTIAIAWLVVVAAEMIAVQSGLGYLILDSRNALRMDYVMVAMIVIGIIGLLLDIIMYKLGRLGFIMAAKQHS
ncbi:MAG: ABC transporter permease [Gammaproteobacteria bacterium]|nr:ABC transporter permease [Gammaproteobacteria bacterium]